jgi:hypothetical protein
LGKNLRIKKNKKTLLFVINKDKTKKEIYMFDSIKKLLSGSGKEKKSENEPILYKKASDLGKETEYEKIPKLEIPTNNKPNILVLDDNEQAGNLTLLDIKMLDSISKKIRKSGLNELSNKQQTFVEQLPNRLFEVLSKIDFDDYNIIIATGTMAAFSIFEALDDGLKVDYAILDILIGGHNLYKGKQEILDGIDVAKKLYEVNPNIKYYFYSGCSLSDESDETMKCQNLLDKNIKDCLITKDKNLDIKRQKILELLA